MEDKTIEKNKSNILKPWDASQTKAVLKSRGLVAKKTLGQNFLIKEDIPRQTADLGEITKTDLVFEIGPGLGALSVFLAEAAGHVVLLEIDSRLALWLNELFGNNDNVEIIVGDALDFDFAAYAKSHGYSEYKIMGNLPYYITTPLIKHFLESGNQWQTMVLMVQKEAAQRLMANAGSKDYSPLNLQLKYFAKLEIVMEVAPENFFPQPEVESVVIRLKRREEKPVFVENQELFFRIISASMAQRRKTLLNSLANSNLPLEKEAWKKLLAGCGLDESRRGETLSLEEFAALANVFSRANKQEA